MNQSRNQKTCSSKPGRIAATILLAKYRTARVIDSAQRLLAKKETARNNDAKKPVPVDISNLTSIGRFSPLLFAGCMPTSLTDWQFLRATKHGRILPLP